MDSAAESTPTQTSAPTPARMRPDLRVVAAVAGVWTLVGLLAACQAGLARLYAGQPVRWGPLVAGYLADWYTCAVFTPLIVLMVRRWPPERLGWWRGAAVYGAPLAAMVVMKYVLLTPLRRLILPGSAPTLAGQLAG